MRRVSVLAVTVLAALAFTSVASAVGENKNTVTFTLDCGAFGVFTGSQPGGAGAALILEDGGLAIAQGLAEDGEVLVRPTPGLARQGKLAECSFTFPGQPERVASVLFVPATP
jgi:hypothetical protein